MRNRMSKPTLGAGVSGKVTVHRSRHHGLVALKQYEAKTKHETSENYHFRVTHEYNQLKQLNHINIIKVYKLHKPVLSNTYYLYMELGGRDTLKTVLSANQIAPLETFCLFKQIAQAVTFLHQSQMCHRDLKLDNFVMGHDGFIKVIDFVDSRVGADVMGIVGTKRYVAPEVFGRLRYDGMKADVWSLGKVLQDFTGLQARTTGSQKEAVNGPENAAWPGQPAFLPFLTNCLQQDPNLRWNTSDFCTDQWYENINFCSETHRCGIDHLRLYIEP